MIMLKKASLLLLLISFVCLKSIAQAKYPTPVESDYIIKNFVFESGEKLPELRVHCITVGEPQKDKNGRTKNAVLIMHGTTGSSKGLLNERFAGYLFKA